MKRVGKGLFLLATTIVLVGCGSKTADYRLSLVADELQEGVQGNSYQYEFQVPEKYFTLKLYVEKYEDGQETYREMVYRENLYQEQGTIELTSDFTEKVMNGQSQEVFQAYVETDNEKSYLMVNETIERTTKSAVQLQQATDVQAEEHAFYLLTFAYNTDELDSGLSNVATPEGLADVDCQHTVYYFVSAEFTK